MRASSVCAAGASSAASVVAVQNSVSTLIGSIIRHHVLANMVMIIVLLAGAMAANTMLREAFIQRSPPMPLPSA